MAPEDPTTDGSDDAGPGRDRNVLIGVSAVAILVIVVLAVAFARDTPDDAATPPPATPAPTTRAPGPTTPESAPTTPDQQAQDDAGNGAQSGGATPDAQSLPLLTPATVSRLTYREGDTVRFRVLADIDDELHVHGYDEVFPLTAARETTISFTASIAGIFEIELHEAGVTIGELTVEP